MDFWRSADGLNSKLEPVVEDSVVKLSCFNVLFGRMTVVWAILLTAIDALFGAPFAETLCSIFKRGWREDSHSEVREVRAPAV